MMENRHFRGREYRCPIDVTLEVIGGKWKVAILWHLSPGTRRFSELKRQFDGITQKMLTQQLRELERDGLVSRTVYAQVPPRVEYTLTEAGMSLIPLLNLMCRWGSDYLAAAQGTERLPHALPAAVPAI